MAPLPPTSAGADVVAPFSAGCGRPQHPAPDGATDCHHHIFDPRFPRANGRTGVWATVSDYRQLQRRLGFNRSIVVSPGSYGFDNSALVDALDQLGDSARGVAAVQASVTAEELARLHRHGVRGIRLYLGGDTRRTPDEIIAFARLVAPLGWHIQILPDLGGSSLEAAESVLKTLPCPLVLDHLAYVPQPEGIQSARWAAVRRLLDGGNTWVKLSGAYITSQIGRPNYVDTHGIARELIRVAPERLVWGTDWPHTLVSDALPDDAQLVDDFADWAPSKPLRQRILVDNPSVLYWAL